MELEEKKILLSRAPWKVLREWRNKEWWYTGAFDAASGAYISWYVVRVNMVDQVTMTIFDPSRETPKQYKKLLWLDRHRPAGVLSLAYRGAKLAFDYRGDEKEGWTLAFDGGGITADLTIRPTIPWFTKFDNEIVENYGLLHFFHNRTSGTVVAGDRRYRLDDALTYYDHCFGRVPTQTGWHWMAVQNESLALSSLVNYGPYAQRYTQAYFKDGEACPRPGEWVRLEQSVSFERQYPGDWSKPWRVSSSDLEISMRIVKRTTNRTSLPPVIPFMVDLWHTEAFVMAEGRIRVDGHWLPTGELYGVMEEHYGRW